MSMFATLNFEKNNKFSSKDKIKQVEDLIACIFDQKIERHKNKHLKELLLLQKYMDSPNLQEVFSINQ